MIPIRGLHLAATVLAAGTVCFRVLVLAPAAPDDRLHRRLTGLTLAALAVFVLSGAAWLALLAANILDVPISEVGLDGVWTVLTETRFGQVWGTRLVLALILAALVWGRTMPWLQVAAGAALIGLIAWVSHAGATPGVLHLAADVAHLLAAAAWLGGLPALILLLSAAERNGGTGWGAFAARTTQRFSVLGVICVGTLLATGLFNASALLAGPADLIETAYGRLLLFKIVLFAAMTALAAVNRQVLTPRLPAEDAVQAVKRNSLAEIALGLAVLFLAAALGSAAPSLHAPASKSALHLLTYNHCALALKQSFTQTPRCAAVRN